MIRSLPPYIYWPFLLFVIAAPAPFGGYHPIPWSINAIIAAILLAAWGGWEMTANNKRSWQLRHYALPLSVGSALALWMIAQLLPIWPAEITPWSWFEQSRYADADRVSLTSNPELGHAVLARNLTNFVIFWLALMIGRSQHRAEHALRAMAFAIGVYAIYGLTMHLSGWNLVLWVERWVYTNSVTGTFINRSHFAALLGLGLVINTAWLFRDWRRETAGEESRNMRVLIEFVEQHWLALMIASAQLAALAMTLSRSGFVASLIALLLVIVLSAMRRKLLLAIGVLLATLLIYGDNSLSRNSQESLTNIHRFEMARIATEAIEHAPLTGHGVGSFRDLIRLYRDEGLPVDVRWRHAHNPYLESSFELGLIGAGLLLTFFVWVAIRLLVGLANRRRGRTYPIIGLGALTLLGLQALLDFGIQTPGVAIPFFAIVGLSVSQTWPSGNEQRIGSR